MCEEEGRLILGFTFPCFFSQLLDMYPNQGGSFWKENFWKKTLLWLLRACSNDFRDAVRNVSLVECETTWLLRINTTSEALLNVI